MKRLLFHLFLLYSQVIYAQLSSEQFDAMRSKDSIAHTLHLHPLPLNCAGVNLGKDYSLDSTVVAIYGEGLFDGNAGHGGARFFVDPAKKVILMSVIGTDRVIEECGITAINFPFAFVADKMDSIPVAEHLQADSLLIKDIQLGDGADKIIRNFGTPNRDSLKENVRTLIYTDDYMFWEEVLFYSAEFVLISDELVRVNIYNGD